MTDEKPRGRPIYGTDISRPLPALIEDLRDQLVKTRGQISDIQHFKGFKDMLETAAQTLTCTIAYLAYVREEVDKAEARYGAGNTAA